MAAMNVFALNFCKDQWSILSELQGSKDVGLGIHVSLTLREIN